MAEPVLRREGNLRLVLLPCDGLPDDPRAEHREVLSWIAGQEGVGAYGPVTVLFDLPPDDDGPRSWRCQVGSAVTGLPRPAPPVLVEDYSQLQALVLPHHEPVRALGATWRLLADHAGAMGWRLRPYWRLALHRRLSADGHLWPQAEVSVFLDR